MKQLDYSCSLALRNLFFVLFLLSFLLVPSEFPNEWTYALDPSSGANGGGGGGGDGGPDGGGNSGHWRILYFPQSADLSDGKIDYWFDGHLIASQEGEVKLVVGPAPFVSMISTNQPKAKHVVSPTYVPLVITEDRINGEWTMLLLVAPGITYSIPLPITIRDSFAPDSVNPLRLLEAGILHNGHVHILLMNTSERALAYVLSEQGLYNIVGLEHNFQFLSGREIDVSIDLLRKNIFFDGVTYKLQRPLGTVVGYPTHPIQLPSYSKEWLKGLNSYEYQRVLMLFSARTKNIRDVLRKPLDMRYFVGLADSEIAKAASLIRSLGRFQTYEGYQALIDVAQTPLGRFRKIPVLTALFDGLEQILSMDEMRLFGLSRKLKEATMDLVNTVFPSDVKKLRSLFTENELAMLSESDRLHQIEDLREQALRVADSVRTVKTFQAMGNFEVPSAQGPNISLGGSFPLLCRSLHGNTGGMSH